MAESESFGALQVQLHQQKRRKEKQNDYPRETREEDGGAEEEEEEEEEEEDEEEEEEEERGITELQRRDESRLVELPSAQAEELKEPPLKTVESAPIISENDQCNGSQENSSSVIHLEARFKGQVEVPNQKVAASLIAQGTQMVNQLYASVCQTSLSELSPTSVTQSISSAPSPTVPEQIVSPLKAGNTSTLGAYQQTSADPKPLIIVTPLKSPIPDGYNWRKYGQKLVKSPKGSRSYYKCTYSNCCAKKIECCDHSGHVIEIVNKGIHSHDPPRKNNSGRENRNASSAGPCLDKNVSDPSVKVLKFSGPATLAKEPQQETPIVPDRKRYKSTVSDGNREFDIKEEHVIEPEPKRRVKKGSLVACSKTLVKSEKKRKVVVHAAGDVGISGDGYRWRKYGQKMVKGNPHPRNYYRCTSAGCPVRKHIETAVDNTSAVVIAYKGVHDHDMPVPKKRHGPASASLVAAAASASMSNLQLKKTDTIQKRMSPTEHLVDKEGELTGETLGVRGEKEKAIESARTLLSIGFEIKPC